MEDGHSRPSRTRGRAAVPVLHHVRHPLDSATPGRANARISLTFRTQSLLELRAVVAQRDIQATEAASDAQAAANPSPQRSARTHPRKARPANRAKPLTAASQLPLVPRDGEGTRSCDGRSSDSQAHSPGLLITCVVTMALKAWPSVILGHSGGAVPESHRSSLKVEHPRGHVQPPTQHTKTHVWHLVFAVLLPTKTELRNQKQAAVYPLPTDCQVNSTAQPPDPHGLAPWVNQSRQLPPLQHHRPRQTPTGSPRG